MPITHSRTFYPSITDHVKNNAKSRIMYRKKVESRITVKVHVKIKTNYESREKGQNHGSRKKDKVTKDKQKVNFQNKKDKYL